MLILLAYRTSLTGMLLCKHCHKKRLTLGKVFAFQTQAPTKGRSWGQSVAIQASLYASLRSNSPLGEEAQAIWSTLAAVIGRGVALIFWLKWLGSEKDTPPKFQKLCWAISFKRRWSSPLWKGPVIRLLSVPSPNHLSCQKEKSLFFPAIHFMPFLNTISPFLIAAHVDEQDWGLRRFCLLVPEYLWDNTLAQRESFSWWSHQFNLANKATFFSLADWRPKTPYFFSVVIFFQLIKCNFFLLSVDPQMKLRHNLSMLWVTLPRRDSHCMA